MQKNINYSSINDPPSQEKASFTLFGILHISFAAGLAIFAVGSVLGLTGQSIALPLFLSTFIVGDVPGMPAYFVIWFCSFCFTIIFGLCAIVLVLKGVVTPEMRAWKWHKYMLLVGLFDSLNGVLIVFSAFLSRVPGPVSAILSNSMIIYTICLSKVLLNKQYRVKQLLGASLVLVGIIITLVPTFIILHEGGGGSAQTWWWPLVALVGYIPGALMNIVQEKMQDRFREEAIDDKRFSVIYFQAVESFYQWLCMCCLFWADLIPGFGVSGNLATWWATFTFDWRCFLAQQSAVDVCERCNVSAAIGVLFIISYLTFYVFTTEMTLYASANLSAVVSTIPPIIAVIFWYAAPSVNAWGGGSPLTHKDLAFNMVAIPFILVGLLVYRFNEPEHKEPDSSEMLTGGVELCC